MSEERSVIVCRCAEYGSTLFHNDDHETLVLVGDKLYALVPTDTTLDELRGMSANEVPHVRHLNCIPTRTKAEQKAWKESSSHKTLEESRQVVKEKLAKEYEIQKVKAAAQQPILVTAPRVSKCRLVTEALHAKALTVDEMMAFGIAKSTAETFKYDLRRSGHKLEEGTRDGKVTLKILADPK